MRRGRFMLTELVKSQVGDGWQPLILCEERECVCVCERERERETEDVDAMSRCRTSHSFPAMHKLRGAGARARYISLAPHCVHALLAGGMPHCADRLLTLCLLAACPTVPMGCSCCACWRHPPLCRWVVYALLAGGMLHLWPYLVEVMHFVCHVDS